MRGFTMPSWRSWLAAVAASVAVAAIGSGLAGAAHADVPVPDCGDVSCDPNPPGGGGGTGGGGGGSTTPQCGPGFIVPSNNTGSWGTVASNVNDVAAGGDGSVWYITGRPGTAGSTVRLGGGAAQINGSLPGGKRIAVDPQGNPWIVDFNGNIFHLVNGSFQQQPGLARDIGVGGNGAVWIIGTNSRNGSFQVWSWTGSSWVADPGSGQEIDVSANGEPVVNGSDGKVWIKDGGANQGWSQVGLGGLTAFDMGLSPCSPAPGTPLGESDMWFVTPNSNPNNLVFSLHAGSTLQGPYTLPNGTINSDTNQFGQITGSHPAVDTAGHAFVVTSTPSCDCAGDLLERLSN